jgi:hypothetical protein
VNLKPSSRELPAIVLVIFKNTLLGLSGQPIQSLYDAALLLILLHVFTEYFQEREDFVLLLFPCHLFGGAWACILACMVAKLSTSIFIEQAFRWARTIPKKGYKRSWDYPYRWNGVANDNGRVPNHQYLPSCAMPSKHF